MARSLLRLLAGAALLADAYAQDFDPVEDMCSRWSHQSIVKNDTLYIYGGIETYNLNTSSSRVWGTLGTNPYFITVDMSQTWDWKASDFPKKIEAVSRPNGSSVTLPPSLMRGALYQGLANDSRIYLYGGTAYMGNSSFPGYTPPDSNPGTLWSFDPAKRTWGMHNISAQSPVRPNHGSYADAPNLGMGFYLNGQIDRGSWNSVNLTDNSTVKVPGMVVLNTVNQTAFNVSTDNLENTGRVGGTMVYVPSIGRKGILVAIGGNVKDGAADSSISGSPQRLVGPDNGSRTEYDSVDILDVAELLDNPGARPVWYNQQTTGNIPQHRIDACAVTASAPDRSSHHIYVYGGVNTLVNPPKMYDDVYILSIPSFTWLQVWSGGTPRWGHSCHVVGRGKSQMLTVGGSLNTTAFGCDWEDKGVGIWDMINLNWTTRFNVAAPNFLVPTAVVDNIGGSPSGGATYTARFNTAALSAVFATTNVPTTAGSGSGSNSTQSSTAAPSSGGTNGGTIAGAVVGALAGLAIIAGGIFFFLRRKRMQKQEQSQPEAPPEEPKPMYGYAPPEMDASGEKYEMGGEKPYPYAHQLQQEAPAELAGDHLHIAEISGANVTPNEGPDIYVTGEGTLRRSEDVANLQNPSNPDDGSTLNAR